MDASGVMSERRAVQGEFFALLVALRDSRERKLAAWAAAHAPPGNAYATARLLDTLRKAGAAEEVLALAAWAAAHAPLGHPYATIALLKALRQAGAADQTAVLLARDPAGHAPLGNPYATAALLKALRQAGAAGQVLALATRAAAHAPLDNPDTTARLLNELHRAGAVEALQLDINPEWMSFDYYKAEGHPVDPVPNALLPNQQGSAYRYYNIYSRDFTTVYAR